MINRRFKNSVTKVITLPGADIESDHNPLCANIKLRLAKAKRKKTRMIPNPKLLRNIEVKSEYGKNLNN